jgi:hypothetical protein
MGCANRANRSMYTFWPTSRLWAGNTSILPATTSGIPTSGWPRADFDPCEAPKIQRRVCLRPERELSVLYFPFRARTPISRAREQGARWTSHLRPRISSPTGEKKVNSSASHFINQLQQDISSRRFSPQFDCELPEAVIAELRPPGLTAPPPI